MSLDNMINNIVFSSEILEEVGGESLTYTLADGATVSIPALNENKTDTFADGDGGEVMETESQYVADRDALVAAVGRLPRPGDTIEVGTAHMAIVDFEEVAGQITLVCRQVENTDALADSELRDVR